VFSVQVLYVIYWLINSKKFSSVCR